MYQDALNPVRLKIIIFPHSQRASNHEEDQISRDKVNELLFPYDVSDLDGGLRKSITSQQVLLAQEECGCRDG